MTLNGQTRRGYRDLTLDMIAALPPANGDITIANSRTIPIRSTAQHLICDPPTKHPQRALLHTQQRKRDRAEPPIQRPGYKNPIQEALELQGGPIPLLRPPIRLPPAYRDQLVALDPLTRPLSEYQKVKMKEEAREKQKLKLALRNDVLVALGIPGSLGVTASQPTEKNAEFTASQSTLSLSMTSSLASLPPIKETHAFSKVAEPPKRYQPKDLDDMDPSTLVKNVPFMLSIWMKSIEMEEEKEKEKRRKKLDLPVVTTENADNDYGSHEYALLTGMESLDTPTVRLIQQAVSLKVSEKKQDGEPLLNALAEGVVQDQQESQQTEDLTVLPSFDPTRKVENNGSIASLFSSDEDLHGGSGDKNSSFGALSHATVTLLRRSLNRKLQRHSQKQIDAIVRLILTGRIEGATVGTNQAQAMNSTITGNVVQATALPSQAAAPINNAGNPTPSSPQRRMSLAIPDKGILSSGIAAISSSNNSMSSTSARGSRRNSSNTRSNSITSSTSTALNNDDTAVLKDWPRNNSFQNIMDRAADALDQMQKTVQRRRRSSVGLGDDLSSLAAGNASGARRRSMAMPTILKVEEESEDEKEKTEETPIKTEEKEKDEIQKENLADGTLVARFLTTLYSKSGKPYYQVLEQVRQLSLYLQEREKWDHFFVECESGNPSKAILMQAPPPLSKQQLIEFQNDFNQALMNASQQVRFAAAQLLLEMNHCLDQLPPIFISIMRHSVNNNDGWIAAKSLGRLQYADHEVISRLIMRFGDDERDCRLALQILRSLSRAHDAILLKHLSGVFNHPIVQVRLTAMTLALEMIKSADHSEAYKLEWSDWCSDVLPMLMEQVWDDWHSKCRHLAAELIACLGTGKSLVQWIAASMQQTKDAKRRCDALKMMAKMKVLTKTLLEAWVPCFGDGYAQVRLEACKVAEGLKSLAKHRWVINALLERTDDHHIQVRIHALKALGACQCKDDKVLDTLLWTLQHDLSHEVRKQVCQSILSLHTEGTNSASTLSSSKWVALKQQLQETSERDEETSVRMAAESTLRQLHAYLPLQQSHTTTKRNSDEAGDGSSNSQEPFMDAQTVLRHVKQLTTKEAILQALVDQETRQAKIE